MPHLDQERSWARSSGFKLSYRGLDNPFFFFFIFEEVCTDEKSTTLLEICIHQARKGQERRKREKEGRKGRERGRRKEEGQEDPCWPTGWRGLCS